MLCWGAEPSPVLSPAPWVSSCHQPVCCSEKVKLVREKKNKKHFFFLPLSNESLGTFSLLTSESYPIAFTVRPDLQRTPWGKAEILVKPFFLKKKEKTPFEMIFCSFYVLISPSNCSLFLSFLFISNLGRGHCLQPPVCASRPSPRLALPPPAAMQGEAKPEQLGCCVLPWPGS